MVDLAIEIYSETMQYAIPISIIFEVGNLIFGTFMRAAFGGRLWIGR